LVSHPKGATERLRARNDSYGPLQKKRANRDREGLRWPRWLSAKRQKIETIFSQLVERYKMKVVRARDTWHFSSRFLRKILSHTMALIFCRREGVSPTRFSELLTDY
jgi:hypothetical protein